MKKPNSFSQSIRYQQNIRTGRMKTLKAFFLKCLLKSWEGLALGKQTEANHFFKLLADIKVVLQLALLNEPWRAA